MMIRLYVIAAWLMLPSLVQAQTAPQRGTADEQKACQSDARRHCRAVLEQGDMAVLGCLQQHRKKLTRGCQAVLTRHGQ
jgi:Cysteine rich repeat